MESFLMFNGYEISASVNEQVDVVLGVASGNIDRDSFTTWLKNHVVDLS
jgi:death-on-curing protein